MRRALPLIAVFTLISAACADEPPRYERRWFYAMMNLQVKEQADRLIELIGQAKSAGYNGVVLADYQLDGWHSVRICRQGWDLWNSGNRTDRMQTAQSHGIA